jgi:hypothetical protein
MSDVGKQALLCRLKLSIATLTGTLQLHTVCASFPFLFGFNFTAETGADSREHQLYPPTDARPPYQHHVRGPIPEPVPVPTPSSHRHNLEKELTRSK